MTNTEIAGIFSLLAKLIDINGGDSFKAKSYASVSFAVENAPLQMCEAAPASLPSLKGIGASSAKKIIELLSTGRLAQLEDLLLTTPGGVVEMLNIKGLGPKKIHTVWKEMELESIGELLYACRENRLKNFKGFGEKTQQSIIESIEFYLGNRGNFLYAQLTNVAAELSDLLQKLFPARRVFITGAFAMQAEIITVLEYVIEENIREIEMKLPGSPLITEEANDEYLLCKTANGLRVKIHAAQVNIIEKLVQTSSSPGFFAALNKAVSTGTVHQTEADYFAERNLPNIPAFLREDPAISLHANHNGSHLQPGDIKGLIHCHSDWSDGNNSIEEMAKAAIEAGMEYMAISDHSRTAAYAQGLSVEKVIAQHEYIDELNERLAPFRIFKSIESDILGDGSLDYDDDILARFNLVIASVHSNLKMTEEKAMKRLIAAIENPYTTILGHMTGRLLLSRAGYPLDHRKIIDACAKNNVVIELNANPNRLDMDWRQIPYALEKGVLISINPDAHSIKGIADIRYGILSAQKAMLNKEQNLSSFSLSAFEKFVAEKKAQTPAGKG